MLTFLDKPFQDFQERELSISKYYFSGYLSVDIESFWTEGYAGQIPNSGPELIIYVLWL